MKVLVSCMKDEGPFILEWLAHHLVVGFDRVIICSNDCTDGSDLLLDALDAAGFCTHVRHHVPSGESAQARGYRLIAERGLLAGASWAMVLDADEFLNIHRGEGRLIDLINAMAPQAQLLLLNWRNFGASGVDRWQNERTTKQYPNANAPEEIGNKGVKSLVRDPNQFTVLANHCPRAYRGTTPLVAQTASGQFITPPKEDYTSLYRNFRGLHASKVSHEWAQINHYATRSMDCFILRGQRGRGWQSKHGTVRHTHKYFEERNQSEIEERSIARYDSDVLKCIAKLREAPNVQEAEAATVAAYSTRIAALHDFS